MGKWRHYFSPQQDFCNEKSINIWLKTIFLDIWELLMNDCYKPHISLLNFWVNGKRAYRKEMTAHQCCKQGFNTLARSLSIRVGEYLTCLRSRRLRYTLQGLKPAPFQVQADFLRTGNSPSSNHEISTDPEPGKHVNYRRHLILQTSKYLVLMLIFFVLHNVFLYNPPPPQPSPFWPKSSQRLVLCFRVLGVKQKGMQLEQDISPYSYCCCTSHGKIAKISRPSSAI